MYSIIIDN